MRKNAARILGLLVTVFALSTTAPRVEAQDSACTLLCIQGYHCCVHGNGNQTCVPDNQAC